MIGMRDWPTAITINTRIKTNVMRRGSIVNERLAYAMNQLTNLQRLRFLRVIFGGPIDEYAIIVADDEPPRLCIAAPP